MSSFTKYFSGLFTGLKSLAGGMRVTLGEFWTRKVTMQYPENRKKLVISDRWRATLIMPHDENNEHACTACGICTNNCPNGTIYITTKSVETEDGKSKKALEKYVWDNGMCSFCNLCVSTCPSDAIKFINEYENAVFTRSVLIHQLNQEGSKLKEKKKEAAKAPVEAQSTSINPEN